MPCLASSTPLLSWSAHGARVLSVGARAGRPSGTLLERADIIITHARGWGRLSRDMVLCPTQNDLLCPRFVEAGVWRRSSLTPRALCRPWSTLVNDATGLAFLCVCLRVASAPPGRPGLRDHFGAPAASIAAAPPRPLFSSVYIAGRPRCDFRGLKNYSTFARLA